MRGNLPQQNQPQHTKPARSQKTKEDWVDEGNNHIAGNDFREAVVAYDYAIKLDRTYALAYNRRGLLIIF